MKQPKFLYKGKEYPVSSISFYEEKLCIISFSKDDEHVTAFQKHFDWESEIIKDEMVHVNLNECLILQEGIE